MISLQWFVGLSVALLLPYAAGLQKCSQCTFISGGSSNPAISSAVNTARIAMDSTTSCITPSSGLTTSCTGSNKCMHSTASGTVTTKDGASAVVSAIFRACVQPESLASDFKDTTCYTNLEKGGGGFKDYTEFFESQDLEISNFAATACFCDDKDSCNTDSIAALSSKNGVQNQATKIGGGLSATIFLLSALVTKFLF